MKILFPISTIFPSQTGGPSNSVYWMAKALHTEGVEVIIVSTNLGIDLNRITSNKWMDTDYGRVIYTSEWIHYLPIRLIFLSLKNIKQADIIHLNSIFYPSSWILAPVAFLWNKKIVWSVRGNFEEKALTYSTWKKKPIIFLLNTFLKKKVVFHTTSEVETQNTKALLSNDIKIIELPNYLELPPKLEKSKVNSQEKYFLYIGRLHPIKALDNLMQALALSKKFRTSEYVFKIAGDGDKNYIFFLEKLITELGLNEKIKLVGHVESEKKQALYANAYFTFLVSYTENFGNVVVESLAQGTPVVASKGTPWQVLENENAGFWITNSPESIADTIDTILSMELADYKEKANNAQELANQQFDIKKNIKKWMDVYLKILENDRI